MATSGIFRRASMLTVVASIVWATSWFGAENGLTQDVEGSPSAIGTETMGFELVAQMLPAEWAALAALQASPDAGAAGTLGPGSSSVPGSLLSGAELVAALREGGYVIYLRHASTDFSQTDSDRQNLADCSTQRNLDDAGRADARTIGEAFRALAIPVGDVFSSEYCRTRETAEIAFGRVTPIRDLTSRVSTRNERERAQRIEALRRLLSTPPAWGVNTVLVGHLFNLQDATGISIGEGEAAVFLPLGASG